MAREQEMLPARRDVEGGAFGIVRLWCLYKFNETEFIKSGIISTTLANGQVVRSRPSVLKINCKYCGDQLNLHVQLRIIIIYMPRLTSLLKQRYLCLCSL